MTNDNNNNLNKFWNNFPYLVSLSENKILDSSAVLFSSNGEKTNFYNIISPNSYTLFLRYNIKGEKIENIVKVIDSLGLGNYLYIIVDNENYKKYFQKRSPDFHKVLILDDDMNLYIDQANFSYIFYTTRNFRIKCIYVPRSEVPSMYIEYLKYLKDSILIKK